MYGTKTQAAAFLVGFWLGLNAWAPVCVCVCVRVHACEYICTHTNIHGNKVAMIHVHIIHIGTHTHTHAYLAGRENMLIKNGINMSVPARKATPSVCMYVYMYVCMCAYVYLDMHIKQ